MGDIVRTNSPECRYLSMADPLLGRAITLIGDFEYGTHTNTEDFFFSTIIGQMMSNSVANVIEKRIIAMCDGCMTADSILSLGVDRLRSAGVSWQKAEYITLFAQRIKTDPSFLSRMPEKTNEEVIRELTELRGIGNWTSKMYLLFVLNRNDVLPYEDGAFLQSFHWLYQTKDTQPKVIMERCNAWKPHTSLASRFMYRLLDYGYTKYSTIEEAERNVFLRQ